MHGYLFTTSGVILFVLLLCLLRHKASQWEAMKAPFDTNTNANDASSHYQPRYSRVKQGNRHLYSQAGGLFQEKRHSVYSYRYRSEEKKSSSSEDNFNTVAAMNNMQGF